MKEELGLDHFEGRSWHGLHHHAPMVMIACAFLQHLRLAPGGSGEKTWDCRSGPPPRPTLPAVRAAVALLLGGGQAGAAPDAAPRSENAPMPEDAKVVLGGYRRTDDTASMPARGGKRSPVRRLLARAFEVAPLNE